MKKINMKIGLTLDFQVNINKNHVCLGINFITIFNLEVECD